MAFYQDGKPVSGLNSIPRLTLAQYNALNVKPEIWIWRDAPESYKKLSADQVSYDSNNTVEDMIDSIDDKELKRWTTNASASATTGRNLYKIANGLLHIWLNIQLTDSLSAGESLEILSGIEGNFGVTLDANIGYIASVCITQDATKTAMFTAQQNKLFIVTGSTIGNTQSNRLWGYLAIPIQQ